MKTHDPAKVVRSAVRAMHATVEDLLKDENRATVIESNPENFAVWADGAQRSLELSTILTQTHAFGLIKDAEHEELAQLVTEIQAQISAVLYHIVSLGEFWDKTESAEDASPDDVLPKVDENPSSVKTPKIGVLNMDRGIEEYDRDDLVALMSRGAAEIAVVFEGEPPTAEDMKDSTTDHLETTQVILEAKFKKSPLTESEKAIYSLVTAELDRRNASAEH